MSNSISSPPQVELTDAELVRQAQQGNAKAFDLLVTRYRGKVYGMCYHLVHNEQDAWDLAQNAFIKAWRALGSFKGDSAFYTWIYRITHNVAYDWLRKHRIESDGEFNDEVNNTIAVGAETAPKHDPSPDDALKNQEIGQRIHQAIAQLSPDHRTVILLREVEGHSYEEIAEMTQTSVGTVMSRLFYARKKLQELLKDTYENT